MMSSNAISTLAKVFYEPKSAFESLKEKPAAWLPLALIILGSMMVFYWYYATVDFPWLVDHTLSAQPDLKPDAKAAMAGFMTKNTMMYSTLGGLLIATPIVFALFGLYYWLAAKVMGSEIGYGKWFHFAIWISVPTLLGLPLMALQIATGHGQISTEDLNMLSMNYLTVHAPLDAPWSGILNNLSLTTFWTLFLSFVGLRVWTGRSATACALAAVLPYALVYGGWALKIAFSH
jgi:hypothetical protein